LSTSYPGTIQTFSNPSGTSTLDSPDHAGLHTNLADTLGAAQAVMGTTAGTSVLKNFADGDFSTRINSSGVLQQTVQGTINLSTFGTPTVTGGTFASPSTTGTDSGTATLTNKTLTNPVIQAYDGWIDANEEWAYASASTITVPTGAAAKYAIGDRLKWTQTTVKYGVITAVADTVLTIAVNTDYVVINATITLNYYSHEASPLGYPHWFDVVAPTFTVANFDNGAGGQPTTTEARFSITGRTFTAHLRATGTKAGTNRNLFVFSSTSPFLVPVNSSNSTSVGNCFVSISAINIPGVMVISNTGVFFSVSSENIPDNQPIVDAGLTMTYEI